ncbi:uncharacterized protein [Salminus brasiliensis]|uniref:uncharacterized protein isoform X2 n=1 Tax=Salminus brasiliensis TaxID=930266 RepID=UPI003B8329DB
MTKLQLLHRALNERLMAAVEQIMEMVGGTVLEYEEETVRARKENEVLRRRLRWMEGETPTDWPDDIEASGFEQPVTVEDESVLNCLPIKMEPIDVSELQSLRPDGGLAASVRSADLDTVHPGTTESTNSGVSNNMVWDSSHSYMAPLDFDPTIVAHLRGRGRSQRMSFACPDCGKVFGREQRLMFHMRIHSAERPYTYRRRKACFYGDKKRKKKLHGLSKVYPSRQFVEDMSDTSEQTEWSTGSATISAPMPTAPSAPEAEPDKASDDTGSSKHAEAGRKGRAAEIGANMPRCLECKRVFKRRSQLAMHMKSHGKLLASQKEQEGNDKTDKKSQQHPKDNAKEAGPENGRACTLKKIFECPYCDKVFSREGWLAPHIRNHTIQKRDPLPKILPNASKKKYRRTIPQLSKEVSLKGKIEELKNGRIEKSETGIKLPTAMIVEPNKLPLESERDSEANRKSKESDRTIYVSSEIAQESERIPQESTEKAGGMRKSKKTFPCQECGKVYLLAGWLKTHKKIHISEKMRGKRQQQQVMEEVREETAKAQNQNLAEKITADIVEKKKKITKNPVEMQDSADSRQSETQDTGAMPSEVRMEKSSDVQAAEAKNEKSNKTKPKIARYKCEHCTKAYSRKNWLNMHMVRHQKTLLALEDQVNDKTQKSDDIQTPQEGSSTEDSSTQNGKDGGKASYPCPFCNKVFRRGMRLMVHMQVHSCEKPYSYRQRKEQFYGDLTRSRVPDTSTQEPAIESSDGDGGFAVTRSHAAVSQDHTSTSEPMESIEPQSVCSGRKLNLLTLHSSGAASNHTMNRPRTGSKSSSRTTSPFSLQPRIVLEPITAKYKTWASPGECDLRSVSTETSAHELQQLSSVLNYPGNDHLQNLLENPNTFNDCSKACSVSEAYENTLYPERLVVNIERQQLTEIQRRMSEAGQKGGEVENLGHSSLDVKQMTINTEPELGQVDVEHAGTSLCNVLSSVKPSFIGIVNDIPPHSINGQSRISDVNSADVLLPVPELISSESNSIDLQQVADPEFDCVTLLDVDSGDDGDDNDDWSNMPDNLDEKETSAGSEMDAGQLGLKSATINQLVQNPTSVNIPLCSDLQNQALHQTAPGKASNAAPNVESILNRSACDGPLANRDEVLSTSVQQAEIKLGGQHGGSTCVNCGLKFAGKASLSQHMRMHSTSGRTRKSVNFKAFKNRAMNNETKIKQQVVHLQTSEALQDASTDNCEVFEDMTSSTVMEIKTVQSSGGYSDIDARSQSSKEGSETHPRSRRSKKGLMTLHCQFCGKACRKIDLHLKYDHPKEPEVMEALRLGKTPEERKKFLSRLCSKKNSESEAQSMFSSDKADTAMDKDLVHCLFCQGSYRRNHFWKHALKCEQKTTGKELTLTEAANSGHTRTSLKKRQREVQKTPNPETENSIKGSTCNAAHETFPKSVKNPKPDVDPSTIQKSLCSATPGLGGGSTNTMKTFDSKSSYMPISDIHNSVTVEPDMEPNLQSCNSVPETHSTSHLQLAIGDPYSAHLFQDTLIGDVEKTDPEAANPCVLDLDGSKSRAPNLESGCSPVLDCVPSETQQLLHPEMDISHVSEDTDKNGEDTGFRYRLLDSDCNTVVKRKWNSQDSEFKEATSKRKWQSDPSQVHSPLC